MAALIMFTAGVRPEGQYPRNTARASDCSVNGSIRNIFFLKHFPILQCNKSISFIEYELITEGLFPQLILLKISFSDGAVVAA